MTVRMTLSPFAEYLIQERIINRFEAIMSPLLVEQMVDTYYDDFNADVNLSIKRRNA